MSVLANPKHEIFAQRVAKGGTQTDAAIAAGYSAKSAIKQGSRLQTNADIVSRIAELMNKAADRAELSAARVLEELRRLSFTDIRTLFDDNGNLKPITSLTEEQAACIGGFEVIKKNAEAGDGFIDTVHKVKVIDKTKALEMLAKHFALLIEKVEHSGGMSFRWLEPGEKG